MIKDAFCLGARVGDYVAYAPGGAGAQEFHTGTISKITNKTVMIVAHGELDWQGNAKIIRRTSGSFVIDVSERENTALRKLTELSEKDKYQGKVYSRDCLMEGL